MPFFSKSPTTISTSTRSSESSTTSELDTVRLVTKKDWKAASACLANAFSEDDVAAYFYNCPDTHDWSAKRKWATHCQIMDAMTFAHLKFGAVHAIGELHDGSYDAAALWMPPGTDMDSYRSMLFNGVFYKSYKTYRKLSKEGRVRLMKEFFPLLNNTKTEVLGDRDLTSWYLVYLGTHARARGKGLAKKLVRYVSKQADAEGRAVYLESSNIVNVPIYEKMGFKLGKQIYLGIGAEKVAMDIMVREPVEIDDTVANVNGMTISMPQIVAV